MTCANLPDVTCRAHRRNVPKSELSEGMGVHFIDEDYGQWTFLQRFFRPSRFQFI
eukprot:CAMPEP_0181136736 /NCGR_PEP_ID=MMETSP1071-20121207/33330_1 /TAXON_ID=35127 /ORGANISM="Thalassiosira sp., Strain NH16" /LENGTH=54 /DNA_ID=CAMNT_0023223441 /DNA_START=279 /DNA_END=440 /DNA_ORIENTATION=-